jgi:hypothetical protein
MTFESDSLRYSQLLSDWLSRWLEAEILQFDPRLEPAFERMRRSPHHLISGPGSILYQGPSYERFEGTGLQGGWGLSSHRHFSAMIFGGHTSTLDRHVRFCQLLGLLWLFINHPFLTAMSVGSTPVSRYRQRVISSLRATATMVMRRMRPLRVRTRSRNQALKELPGW